MKKQLKNYLPKSFKKSKLHKGAYTLDKGEFSISIRLEDSDFLDGEDKWVFVISIDVNDNYRQDLSKGSMLHVFDASVSNMKIEALDRWDQIDHWAKDDVEGIEDVLTSIIIPWIDSFGAEDLIAYLQALDGLEFLEDNSNAIERFGSLLTIKKENQPRTRKYFNGSIAGLLLSLGKTESALDSLIKHREFIEKDNVGNVDAIKKLLDSEIAKLQSKSSN